MKKIIYIILLIIMIGSVEAKRIEVKYDSCVDGDTAWLKIGKKIKKFRFIGINAPEIEHEDREEEYMGNAAKEAVCNYLTEASKIEIEYDENSKKTDKYDRHLAWIWVDDLLLQELLVQDGLAKVDYIYNEYKYVDLLCKREIKAKDKKIGIWSKNNKIGYCKKYIGIEETIPEEIEKDEHIDKLVILSVVLVLVVVIVMVIVTILVLNKRVN